MIKINLLPHREARRKQAKSAFVAMLVLASLVGLIVVVLVGAVLASAIENQERRNKQIQEANQELDSKISEISKLKQEIEALKSRQQAVEDLQSDRNQPVQVMDELVKQTPEGVYLKSFKQEGQRITLKGNAQSNERVSELLRNLTPTATSTSLLEKPELKQIQLVTLTQGTGGTKVNEKQAKKVYDFEMTVNIRRQREKEPGAKNGRDGKPAANIGSAASAQPAKAASASNAASAK